MVKRILIIVTVFILTAGSLFIINLYRVGSKPDNSPLQTKIPDSVGSISTPAASLVGKITRHANNFINKNVKVRGYLIKKEIGYIIISDEASGAISMYDLPVIGPGIDAVKPNKKYVFQGMFLGQGRVFSNNSPDHLELSQPPELASP